MPTKTYRQKKVAIMVPCYNEEIAIAQVIADFKKAIPEAAIVVFDNNSSDRTTEVSLQAGAQVAHVSLKGKGNVVRRMFADIEADVYVMVDGDATYEAGAVKRLIDHLIDNNLDMVVGCREEQGDSNTYRQGHRWGNKMLTGTVSAIFGGQFTDMLSGYRAFSRRYAKSFPAIAKGFEIETELTVHALELRMPYGEISTQYGARPEGSESKLSTYKDGWRILKTIIRLHMMERPLTFFGVVSALMALLSVILAAPIFVEYLTTGLVSRLPTAVLSMGLMLSALLSLVCGIIQDTVTRGRHETKRLMYLSIPAIKNIGFDDHV